MPGEDLRALMNALVLSLGAALPGRLVTRQFRPLSQRSRDELLAGVVCVVALGESGYANYRGREADLGRVKVVLVCQLEADSPDPAAVEDAEFELAGQIKAFLAGPCPAPVRQMLSDGFRQSGQLDAPQGWVVFELEVWG